MNDFPFNADTLCLNVLEVSGFPLWVSAAFPHGLQVLGRGSPRHQGGRLCGLVDGW